MSGFHDDVAVVTGGTRGIGRAVAERLADGGATVVATYHDDEEAAERTRERLGAYRAETRVERCDVTDFDAVGATFETVADRHGPPTVLVNNAGTMDNGLLVRMTPDQWDRVIETNLTGTFFCCQAAGERMIETDADCQIINMSSIYGSGGVQGRAPYNASKAGIENLTRNAAVELAEDGVQVNALAPGYIKTRMAEAPWGESIEDHPEWPYYGYAEEHIENRTSLGRFGTHEELENCATFLAAGEHYMNGEILTLDGGWLSFGWGSKGR